MFVMFCYVLLCFYHPGDPVNTETCDRRVVFPVDSGFDTGIEYVRPQKTDSC